MLFRSLVAGVVLLAHAQPARRAVQALTCLDVEVSQQARACNAKTASTIPTVVKRRALPVLLVQEVNRHLDPLLLTRHVKHVVQISSARKWARYYAPHVPRENTPTLDPLNACPASYARRDACPIQTIWSRHQLTPPMAPLARMSVASTTKICTRIISTVAVWVASKSVTGE